MAPTATVTTSQFDQLESRISGIETVLKQLLGVFDKKTPAEIHRLSEKAERRYLKELVKFLEEEKVKPKPGFTSAKELIDYLEQI